VKKVVLLVALFALMAGVALAAEANYKCYSTDVGALTTDTLGGQTDGTAFIYARFSVAGLYFQVQDEDVWACSAMVPADSVVSDNGIEIENTGGVACDLAFHVSNEDVNESAHTAWTLHDAWECPADIDKYTLGLVVTDSTSSSDFAADDYTEFGSEDMLTGTAQWYLAAGQHRPLSEIYADEGATSLKLKAGPATEDEILVWFFVIMSEEGASNTDIHTAQITVTGREATDS